MERKLRALGETAQQDQQQRGHEHRIGLDLCHLPQHGADFVGASNLAQQHKATEHGQAASTGHGQCLTGACPCVGTVAPVAHQQEGRQTGELPEHHQQQQVVRQDHPQHGRHEQHHLAVELGHRVLQTEVEVGIDDDQQPDEQDESRKHQGQAVQPEHQVQTNLRHPLPAVHHHLTRHHSRGMGDQQHEAGQSDQSSGQGSQQTGFRPQPHGRQGTQQERQQNNEQQHGMSFRLTVDSKSKFLRPRCGFHQVPWLSRPARLR